MGKRKRSFRKKAPRLNRGSQACPDIFRYHDYRSYLRDWLAFSKAGQSRLSMRDFAKKTSLSVSYLSMVLSSARKLTEKAAKALHSALELSAVEQLYFDLLVEFGNSETQEERLAAYEKLCRMRPYREVNIAENVAYQYLSHWYYVAIREMASLEGFRPDPAWIQPRLRYPVELKDIGQALEFLVANKFIEILRDGTVRPPERPIDCQGGVFKLALTKFHREMFALAARSIDVVPSDERNILGYTLSVSERQFETIRAELDEFYRKLEKIAQEQPSGEKVVHVELALFPLTTAEKKKGSVT